MLRHVYLEVGALRLAAEHLTIDWLPEYVSHSGWRIAPAVAKALRAHPGSYVNLEGSYVPLGDSGVDPDGFIQFINAETYGDMNVLLDCPTGNVYYSFSDEHSNDISFCAPSVEDWLEREFDASWHVRSRYHPQAELTTIVEITILSKTPLRVPITVEENREDTVDAAEAARESRRETKLLRAENLTDDDPSEAERSFVKPDDQVVWRAGWELERARHQILGQMYALMGSLGENLELSGYSEEEQTVLQTLQPLLVADAELAPILTEVRSGRSDLYDLASIKRRIQHIASNAE